MQRIHKSLFVSMLVQILIIYIIWLLNMKILYFLYYSIVIISFYSYSMQEINLKEKKVDPFILNIQLLAAYNAKRHNNESESSLNLCSTGIINLSNFVSNQIQLKGKWLDKENLNIQSLKHLNLASNQIALFPSEVIEISTLESLNVANNNLVEIPIQIKNLTALRELNISFNRLINKPIHVYKSNLQVEDVGNPFNPMSQLSSMNDILAKLVINE